MITPQLGDSRLVAKGSQVNEGDTIITFKGGEAQLHMLDGAYLMVRESSRLQFRSPSARGMPRGAPGADAYSRPRSANESVWLPATMK